MTLVWQVVLTRGPAPDNRHCLISKSLSILYNIRYLHFLHFPLTPLFNGLNRAHLTVNAELDNLSILVLPCHKQIKIEKYLLEWDSRQFPLPMFIYVWPRLIHILFTHLYQIFLLLTTKSSY